MSVGGDVGDVEVKSSAPRDWSGASNQLHAPLVSPRRKSLFYVVDSRLSGFLMRSELSCQEWYTGCPTRKKSLYCCMSEELALFKVNRQKLRTCSLGRIQEVMHRRSDK
jgi:hypothetical protein